MKKHSAKITLLILLAIAACNLAAGKSPLTAEDAARIFKPAGAPLPDLISETEKFNRSSNGERFQTLIKLLAMRGLDFRIQSFTHHAEGEGADRQGTNVVLNFGRGNRALVFGAHFDAARLPDGRIGPGIVDNAAAVVILIRLAHAIQHSPLNKRLHIVFFDMEESGLIGSKEFVRSLDRDRIEAMVNVDIVGYGDTVIFGPSLESKQSRLAGHVRGICAQLSIDCFLSPRLPAGDFRSFRSAGIPSVLLAILPAAEAHQMWLMFNKPEDSGLRRDFAPPIARIIHTSDDTVNKLDPAAMTMVYNLLGNLLAELDKPLR